MIIKLLKGVLRTFFATAFLFLWQVAQAEAAKPDPTCQDSQLISGRLITDMCWDCVLPIRVAGAYLGGGQSQVPSKSTKKVLCLCEDDAGLPRPGFVTSMWEPARLIEFQRTPGCSSVLGGIRMFPANELNRGSYDEKYSTSKGTFTHYHYYAFPLLLMLDLFTGSECNAGGYMDLDIMYLSELDPTWNIDSLAFFTTPEAAVVANPLAILACTADALKTGVGAEPIDPLFWCAGTWGKLYPLGGHVVSSSGVLHATSLLKTRVLAALHRRGLAWQTMGDDALCGGFINPMLVKSQYKFALSYPVAETKHAHKVGGPALIWGINKIYPGAEDPIYTIFRWKDCCITAF